MQPTIPRPSTLIKNICLETVDQWQLFKFDDELQNRMEDLLERKKGDQISPEEQLELDAIAEMERIFTHINALLIANP
jgi:hypothetical protein